MVECPTGLHHLGVEQVFAVGASFVVCALHEPSVVDQPPLVLRGEYVSVRVHGGEESVLVSACDLVRWNLGLGVYYCVLQAVVLSTDVSSLSLPEAVVQALHLVVHDVVAYADVATVLYVHQAVQQALVLILDPASRRLLPRVCCFQKHVSVSEG